MNDEQWRCGNPDCDKSLPWHVRKVENLEYTIGPVAAQEFEQDHPDPDVSPIVGERWM